MASGEAQRRAIARATQVARREQIAWREQQAQAVAQVLASISRAIELELLSLQDGGRDVRAEQIPTLQAFLAGQYDALLAQYGVIVQRTMPESARIGATVLDAIGAADSDQAVIASTLDWLKRYRAADGLTLSDRVWRVATNASRQLGPAIENGIVRGQSSYQAALEFIQQGKPVPEELQLGMKARQASALARRAKDLLTNPGADVLYAAQRVLRTESNRAYTESYVTSVAQHPDVIGVKFTLSPNHPKTDICDLYAGANLHGLGPGVYPPGNHPYPAHPNTLSYLQPVFADEVTDADRAGRETAFTWLDKQPSHVHVGVLGGQKKAAAFAVGELAPEELLAPWYQVAARLGRDA